MYKHPGINTAYTNMTTKGITKLVPRVPRMLLHVGSRDRARGLQILERALSCE